MTLIFSLFGRRGFYGDGKPGNNELTIRHQFDRLCCMALKGELANYIREIEYRREHEISFSQLSEEEMLHLSVELESAEGKWFQVLGYDIFVRDILLAEALECLNERRLSVTLMSYFLDMSDAEIGRTLNVVRSTVHEHRKKSLEILREKLKEGMDEQGEEKTTGE